MVLDVFLGDDDFLGELFLDFEAEERLGFGDDLDGISY
jgi:hypothetical protein